MPAGRLTAVYHVNESAGHIAARAEGIAVEQSVEMPVAAISDRTVLENIVGRVEAITELSDGVFEVSIELSVATTGMEAGQLFNMLFGNTSLHPDVMLKDAVFPEELLAAFGGPRHGHFRITQTCRRQRTRIDLLGARSRKAPAPASLAELARPTGARRS